MDTFSYTFSPPYQPLLTFFFFLPVPCDFEQALHVLLHVVVLSEAKLQAGVFLISHSCFAFQPLLQFWLPNRQWLSASVVLIENSGVIKAPIHDAGLDVV